ncbi:uncharacterized protein LOC124421625 isoform X2 [Vespa crabro]|nr:uncharacterized protein LOC124421625 isoform X2 [Vespa crabro]
MHNLRRMKNLKNLDGVLTELIVVYIITYINFWIDAEKAQKEVSQISRIYMSDNSSHFWVAELYEDYSLNRQERDQRYKFMTKEKFNQSNINVSKYVKKIVGTIGLCKNNKLQNSGWIKRLCVHKNYRRKGIGINLVNVALEYGSQQKYRCINVIISVHRKAARELFITKNFEIYSHHKKLHRTSVTLSFIELTYQLRYISNDEFFATDTIYAQTL